MVAIEIKSGTTKQQLMSIPTKLKEVQIDCKRTWFMDVRPCQHIFIVILQLCALVMERKLKITAVVDNTITVDDLVSMHHSDLNSRIEKISMLQHDIAFLEKSVDKLQKSNKNSKLSLSYIRAALDEMNRVYKSPFAECKQFAPHHKYQLEYPQVKEKHPLLRNLMLNGDYNASLMVKILADTLESSPIEIPEINVQENDINEILHMRDNLDSSVNKSVLDNLKIDQRPHFERLEI